MTNRACTPLFSCYNFFVVTIFRIDAWGDKVRSTWANDTQTRLILSAMIPENRLALEVSDATGLRIDDVLALPAELVRRTARPYVTDSKTGKRHRIYLPIELRTRMLAQAGKVWVWPGRTKPLTQHRTRQAVYKDMVRAVQIMRRAGHIPPQANPTPHTMRKRAAVRAYRKGGYDAAQALLQHSRSDAMITMLYALSDQAGILPRAGKSGRKRIKK